MAVGDAHVFPGFLTPVLTQLFFPKQPTTFLTCFCRGERRKYAGKKSGLNQGSNSQPPGHESDTLTTEPPGRGHVMLSPNKVIITIGLQLMGSQVHFISSSNSFSRYDDTFCNHGFIPQLTTRKFSNIVMWENQPVLGISCKIPVK